MSAPVVEAVEALLLDAAAAIRCQHSNHADHGTGRAVWVVWVNPCECDLPVIFTWCDGCLSTLLTSDGPALCRTCAFSISPARAVIARYEPIGRAS